MRNLTELVANASGDEKCPRGYDAMILYSKIGQQASRHVYFIPEGQHSDPSFGDELRVDFYTQAPTGAEYIFIVEPRKMFNAQRLARGMAALEERRRAISEHLAEPAIELTMARSAGV